MLSTLSVVVAMLQSGGVFKGFLTSDHSYSGLIIYFIFLSDFRDTDAHVRDCVRSYTEDWALVNRR